MADDWWNIALRFALYVDLMVLFGLPLFATYSLGRSERLSKIGRQFFMIAAAASVAGLLLSGFGMLEMAKQMVGGADYSAVTRHVLQMILTRTGAGMAWVVRLLALGVCLAAAVAVRRDTTIRFRALSLAGAIAVATLAWSGHGAMNEGARGFVHLVSDVAHLIAAGAWVGALVAFVTLAASSAPDDGSTVEVLARSAAGFAWVGSAVVVTLALTGIVNYLMVVGATVQGLFTSTYGRLLSAKMLLFTGMLGLAAANRFVLTRRLQAAVASREFGSEARALRKSLWTETGLAFAVLGLVAWLGVLSPPA